MARRMVVDWSVLMHLNWHKMRSPNFEARTGLEVAEFARNIVSHVLYLVERVGPDELVLAMDAPTNWRSGVYSRYYDRHVEYHQFRARSGLWVLQFDRKTYLVKYRDDMGKWETTKLNKADTAACALGDPLQWRRWSPCPVDPVEDSTDEEPVLWVREAADWPHLEPIVPTYKGNRKTSRWDYETTKAEFKALGANLGQNVAATLGGHAIRVEMAEGDDVCAVYVKTAPADDKVVLVTIDTDLHQLLIDRPDLRIFDPKAHRWVDKSPERATFELVHKVLTGDSSDNIAGVALRAAAQTLGDKTAEKLIADNGGPELVWDYLLDQVDDDGKVLRHGAAEAASLDRNLELVSLSYLPAEIEHAILDAFDAMRAGQPVAPRPEPTYLLDAFGLTAADVMVARATGRQDQEIDDGLREGDPVSHDGLGAKSS